MDFWTLTVDPIKLTFLYYLTRGFHPHFSRDQTSPLTHFKGKSTSTKGWVEKRRAGHVISFDSSTLIFQKQSLPSVAGRCLSQTWPVQYCAPQVIGLRFVISTLFSFVLNEDTEVVDVEREMIFVVVVVQAPNSFFLKNELLRDSHEKN